MRQHLNRIKKDGRSAASLALGTAAMAKNSGGKLRAKSEHVETASRMTMGNLRSSCNDEDLEVKLRAVVIMGAASAIMMGRRR